MPPRTGPRGPGREPHPGKKAMAGQLLESWGTWVLGVSQGLGSVSPNKLECKLLSLTNRLIICAAHAQPPTAVSKQRSAWRGSLCVFGLRPTGSQAPPFLSHSQYLSSCTPLRGDPRGSPRSSLWLQHKDLQNIQSSGSKLAQHCREAGNSQTSVSKIPFLFSTYNSYATLNTQDKHDF